MEIYKLKPVQKKIAENMGAIELCAQTAEELSELAQILLTYRRTQGAGQPTNKSVSEVMYKIHEEIADSLICIKEIIYMLDISEDLLEYIEHQKIDRTCRRYGIKESDYEKAFDNKN